MKISILTLFENYFDNFLNTSIIKRAIEKQFVSIEVINFRKYSKLKHFKVDDTAYGGGAGMVLMLQPIIDCLNEIKKANSLCILLSPCGKQFNQEIAYDLSKYDHLIFICGHYEGIDERILNYIDIQLSIGDFILTGGEPACLVMMDAIIRLIPNVINKQSLATESFNNYLLDYPVYTKPENFNGYQVPKVLLSGNHNEINNYRNLERINKTKKYRKDLYIKYKQNGGK